MLSVNVKCKINNAIVNNSYNQFPDIIKFV